MSELYKKYAINRIFPSYSMHSNILSKNIDSVKNKIFHMRMDGINNLVILSDFDYTMTNYYVQLDPLPDTIDTASSVSTTDSLRKGFTCHTLLEDSDIFDSTQKEKANHLFEKYYPIEQDLSMDYDLRTQHMLEWNHESHRLLIETNLCYSVLKDVIKQYMNNKRIVLRKGCIEFLQYIQKHTTPMLIFSAGIANVIEEILSYSLSSNTIDSVGNIEGLENLSIKAVNTIQVISNRCVFDTKTGYIHSVSLPSIHSLNKNIACLNDYRFIGDPTDQTIDLCVLVNHRNVLLIGDSISDADMTIGMNYDPNKSIKIGYFNNMERLSHDWDRIQIYLDCYDILILPISREYGHMNPTFDIPFLILRYITGEHLLDI